MRSTRPVLHRLRAFVGGAAALAIVLSMAMSAPGGARAQDNMLDPAGAYWDDPNWEETGNCWNCPPSFQWFCDGVCVVLNWLGGLGPLFDWEWYDDFGGFNTSWGTSWDDPTAGRIDPGFCSSMAELAAWMSPYALYYDVVPGDDLPTWYDDESASPDYNLPIQDFPRTPNASATVRLTYMYKPYCWDEYGPWCWSCDSCHWLLEWCCPVHCCGDTAYCWEHFCTDPSHFTRWALTEYYHQGRLLDFPSLPAQEYYDWDTVGGQAAGNSWDWTVYSSTTFEGVPYDHHYDWIWQNSGTVGPTPVPNENVGYMTTTLENADVDGFCGFYYYYIDLIFVEFEGWDADFEMYVYDHDLRATFWLEPGFGDNPGPGTMQGHLDMKDDWYTWTEKPTVVEF